MKKYSALLLLLLSAMTAAASHAQTQSLRLPRLFADHMVLQRDAKVRFWGWAQPQQQIAVEINGAGATTRSDAAGAWELLYPASAAGGPYEVVIRAGAADKGETVRLKDVYFGDVWLAGGQSNMEWKVAQSMNAPIELKNSNFPLIRFFEVPNELSPAPRQDLAGGRWVPASPETVKDFSAVGWFFAKHNHTEKNVPVGVIDSTWGGTPAEAWVDANRLLELKDYESEARFALDPQHDWKAVLAANDANERLKWQLIGDKERVLKLKAHQPNYNDGDWKTVMLPNRQPLSHFAWLRRSFELTSADLALPAALELGELVQNAMVFVNGRLIAEENWFNSGAHYPLPGGLLKKGRNVIALRVANDWNNEVYVGKPGQMRLDLRDRKINLEGEWRYNNAIEPQMPMVFRYNWTPGFLYNAMIHPIQGYSLRGAIWYQGESNTDQPQTYARLFKTLITDWRAKWRQGDFPFLFVQLAGFDDPSPNADWPLLREAQAQALELPNTGMAVALDIGDAEDIHPRNKQDVGKRLWLNARKVAFKEKVVHSGPTYKSHKISGDRIILRFDHVGRTFMVANPPQINGFQIAGADKQFHTAEATFKGDVVTVRHPDVPSPVAVRYGWYDHFEVELFSWDMLPAVPFRTDDW